MTDKKISLVIPAYNEAAIIDATICSLLSCLERSFSEYELIISDDGSTDETKAIVEKIKNAHLRCVSHFPNKGKGAAVREGILAARGDIILCTDADLAYGTDILPQMVERLLQEDADIVIGSRKLHPEGYADYPPIRLLASRVFSSITRGLSGADYDTQCGLKAYTAEAAERVFSLCETNSFAYDFEVVMIASELGMKISQYPAKIINHRQSKINVLRDSFKMLGDVVRIRRRVSKRLGEVKNDEDQK